MNEIYLVPRGSITAKSERSRNLLHCSQVKLSIQHASIGYHVVRTYGTISRFSLQNWCLTKNGALKKLSLHVGRLVAQNDYVSDINRILLDEEIRQAEQRRNSHG